MASIRERVSTAGESRWAVLYRHGQRQASTTFPTEKEAVSFKALVDSFGVDRALKLIESDGQDIGNLTVGQLAEKFLEAKAKQVTARTDEQYRRDFANWIEPWFGHRAAELIDEADVQKWVDHMATKLSPKSVMDRHMLLHSIYKWGRAKSRKLVSHNPCEETELPKAVRKPPKGTTLAEWHALREAATKRGNPDAADLIQFLGTVGWRFSEATALAVRDVDDDGTNVWVDVTQVFRKVGNKQVLVPDAAKSYAGFRRVPLPAECAAMVRRRLVGKGPGDYVFTNSAGNHWNQHTFLRDTWPKLVADANLGEGRKPTPHWLRHMAVYAMHAAGADVVQIQRTIGHESPNTTIGTYGGLIGGIGTDVAAKMDDVLSRKPAVVAGTVVPGELA